ncbi:MAG: UDP-3-O-(3-hydroxymyristoyl)glucosamine N-acyltransferase [Chromatiales bacterium]|nr:UDP-3-O-(3-hydroxymyristoyl)glucosamine N-acyltransferase [Chromatiales bacterium]
MTLAQVARIIGAELHGDPSVEVERVAPLGTAGVGCISFLHNRRYRRFLPETRATAVILEPEHLSACPTAALVTDNPYLGYARVATALAPAPQWPIGIDPSASVSPDAVIDPRAHVGARAVIGARTRIGAGVFVGPGCVIEHEVEIGEGCRLSASVTVCHGVTIGRRVLIHPGVVIGADGFGIARDGEVWVKVPQLGAVRIGDDVEIGANTTIDRGALEDTVIEEGVKLDNLIQIGHNVHIGAHTAIAACVAIGGSARIGRRCTIGGAASLAGHLEIADDVHLTATSAVPNSITEPGIYSSGMPVQENRAWRRNIIRLRQLDEMARRIKALEDAARE